MNLKELIEQYITLRDKKSELKREYETKVKKVDDVLDKMEGAILTAFESTGIDSAKTEHGTAYVSTRTTASVADRDVFMRHVVDNQDWTLLEVRCSKAAVEQYTAANEEPPPGVNISSTRVVNIRRSA